MANIKIPRKEFEKHIKITEEIEEKIHLFGTPLESLSSEEIEIEIFPNRPDLLSTQGYLRAFKAFMGKETGLKKYKINPPQKDFKVIIDKSVKNIRPFTACAIVKNLKFDDEKIKEIIDLQEKLHSTVGRNRRKVAIGIYPLEKIQLPITYLAKSQKDIKFVPLGSDKEMTGLQILQRHSTGREYAYLLEDYDKYPIFMDANKKILSMPPIINSHETGKITENTKEVFVECSGSNFETLKKTLNIIVTTLAEMDGKIHSMNLIYDKKQTTPNLTLEKMKISLENINLLLGLKLKESDLQKLLPRMGYEYKNKTVSIPAWRTDILHEVDIAEDIAIAYGYDKIIPEIPNIATVGEESGESKIKSKISEILIGLNLIETSSYHLIKEEESKNFKLENIIELENSKVEYKILRPNLLIPTLRILSENKDNEYPQRIFEIGTVFEKDKENKTETGIIEKENLLVALTPSNFTEIKQILDNFSKSLNIELRLEEAHHPGLIEGRSASIKFNNKVIGYLAEMHPETLKKASIKMPIGIFELSLDEVFNCV